MPLFRDVELERLRERNPCALTAVLAIGAKLAPSNGYFGGRAEVLADVLEREWREELARKVIVEGQKSLDLVQGLLVYLGWYV